MIHNWKLVIQLKEPDHSGFYVFDRTILDICHKEPVKTSLTVMSWALEPSESKTLQIQLKFIAY